MGPVSTAESDTAAGAEHPDGARWVDHVGSPVTDISAFARIGALDHGLSVVTTLRPDRSVQASVVNAGVLTHPLTGANVVGFVAQGSSRKLAHLRADAHSTVVVRAGWQWAAVEGLAEIFGPDDPRPGITDVGLRALLRDVFLAAGGTHDDWGTYDRVMLEERRAAVLVMPRRSYPHS